MHQNDKNKVEVLQPLNICPPRKMLLDISGNMSRKQQSAGIH